VIRISIYSRPGCHLCDEMKSTVSRVAAVIPLILEEIDIATDPVLESLFGQEIPVLMVDGKKAAKHRVTEQELTRILAGRTGEADTPR
jgi:hypothetical protein